MAISAFVTVELEFDEEADSTVAGEPMLLGVATVMDVSAELIDEAGTPAAAATRATNVLRMLAFAIADESESDSSGSEAAGAATIPTILVEFAAD